MGNRNKHILLKIIPEETWGYIAVCGDTAPSDMFMTRHPEYGGHLCPKCSSKYFGQKLKETPNGYTLAERLNLSEDRLRWEFKSIYPVLNGAGEKVAFIAIENGWGKSWGVYGLHSVLLLSQMQEGAEPPPAEMDTKEPAQYTLETGTVENPRRVPIRANRFSSKEHALSMIPSMVADNFLMTAADIRASDLEAIANSVRRRKARQAEEHEIEVARAETKRIRDEKIAQIEESFTKLCKADSGLSNFDRTALADAASLLGIRIPDLV